jgi:hypothetical protein
MIEILSADVIEIRARAEAATPGPWWEDHAEIMSHDGMVSMPCVRPVDAEFIAHARTDVPALCERVRVLTETLAGVYDMLPRWSCKSMEPDGCPVCVARSVLAAAPSEPTVCPTCGSDDPERFDGGCGEDTGQPSGMDIGGHLIYDQPDAFHRLSEETTP